MIFCPLCHLTFMLSKVFFHTSQNKKLEILPFLISWHLDNFRTITSSYLGHQLLYTCITYYYEYTYHSMTIIYFCVILDGLLWGDNPKNYTWISYIFYHKMKHPSRIHLCNSLVAIAPNMYYQEKQIWLFKHFAPCCISWAFLRLNPTQITFEFIYII